MRQRPTNSDDIIDSRDVIEAIEEIESELEDLEEGLTCDTCGRVGNTDDAIEAGGECQEPCEGTVRFVHDDEVAELREELAALKALAEEAEGYAADWLYGETLIRDSYFEDYAQQLAEDIGALNSDAGWPLTYIDWEAAARALQQDYTSVEFDGVTYWVR